MTIAIDRNDGGVLHERLNNIITLFPSVRVHVIGDIMLDIWTRGSVQRISPEAPVPVFEYEEQVVRLGGAGNVANNFAMLGADVSLYGVVGNDHFGKKVAELCESAAIRGKMSTDKDRPTTTKQRFTAGNHQLLRVDREVRRPLSLAQRTRIFDEFFSQVKEGDVVAVADYAKGMFTPERIDDFIARTDSIGVRVYVDPSSPRHLVAYHNAFLVKPNRKTVEDALGMSFGSMERDLGNINEVFKGLYDVLGCSFAVTLGRHGILAWDNKKSVASYIPTVPLDVYDVVGAGDTTFAALVCAMECGADLMDAAKIANTAASVVVQKPGTATCTVDELRAYLARINFVLGDDEEE